jgi:Cdc6-like AAA superfamily ATPase
MSQEFTDIKTLNQIIEQYNPFTSKVAAQHNIWSSDDPSIVESINQNAFNSVVKLIDDVDTGKSSASGALLVGERGLGKTQLLARLHHHLNEKDKAFFVYMGEYENLDAIKTEFLQAIVYSLKRNYRANVTQWQVLAAEMYFDARGNRPCSVEHLVKQFPSVLAKNPNLIKSWTNGIAQKCPDVKNVFLIRAILWTLFPDAAPFAAMWLAGKKLSEEEAKSLGLPIDREVDSFSYTCDLINLINRYKTIVFCFDELDILQVNSQMLSTVQVVLELAKYLQNNIKRIVVLLAVFPQTLQDDIKRITSSLSSEIRAAYDRVENEIYLEPLDAQTSLSLINHRLQQFYKTHNVNPSNPFYPFERDSLCQVFASERATARQVLRWCEENWTPQPPIVIPNGTDNPHIEKPHPLKLINRIEECYKEQAIEINDRVDEFLTDNSDKISKALRFAFDHLVDQVVDELRVFEVIDEQDRAYKEIVPFKLRVRKAENKKGAFTFIGIAVVQKTGGALTSTLSKLVEFNKLNQTRACIVRSNDIKGDRAKEYALAILQNGGEWVALQREHIAPIFALQALSEKLEQYDLRLEEILGYAEDHQILTANPLIQEILSKPEGKPPKNAKLSDINSLASIPKISIAQESSEDSDIQMDDSLFNE